MVEDRRGKTLRFAIRYQADGRRRYETLLDVETREEAAAVLAERLAGLPSPPPRKAAFEYRLKCSMRAADECWPWQGALGVQRGEHTYGKYGGRWVHRLVYEHLAGPIPEGHDLHHVCETKSCVNPAHIEVLAHGEHTRVTHKKRRNGQRSGSRWDFEAPRGSTLEV